MDDKEAFGAVSEMQSYAFGKGEKFIGKVTLEIEKLGLPLSEKPTKRLSEKDSVWCRMKVRLDGISGFL